MKSEAEIRKCENCKSYGYSFQKIYGKGGCYDCDDARCNYTIKDNEDLK